MHTATPFEINVRLDCRPDKRNSDGLCHLYLRIHSTVENKPIFRYLKKYCSESDYSKMFKSDKTPKSLRELKNYCDAVRLAAEKQNNWTKCPNGYRSEIKKALSSQKPTSIKLKDGFKFWINKSKLTNTKDSYTYTEKALIRWKGEKKYNSLTYADVDEKFIEDWKNWLLEYGRADQRGDKRKKKDKIQGKKFDTRLSRGTLPRYLKSFKAVLGTAVKEKIIQNNPFDNIKIQGFTKKKIALSNEELEKIWNYKPQTFYEQRAMDFWKFSFLCFGLNLNDIARIERENVFEDHFTYMRRKTVNNVSDVKEKNIDLNDDMKEIIKRQESKGHYLFPFIKKSDSQETITKKLRVVLSDMRSQMHKIANKLEVKNFSMTWARHSFATKSVRDGYDLKKVGQLMDHSSTRVTDGYFAGWDDDMQKEIQKNLTNFKKKKE